MSRLAAFRIGQREALLVGLLIALYAAIGSDESAFVSRLNITNVLYDASTVAIIAVGAGIVIIGGGIDISVGSALAATATIAGLVAQTGANGWFALFAGIAAGAGLGLINGILIVGLRIAPIVATLATLGIFRGVLAQTTKSSLVGNFPGSFSTFGQSRFLTLPYPVWIMFAVLLAGALWMRYTGAGRTIYAIGNNPRAARLAGIKVERYQALTYCISGALAGLAGAIFAARNGTVLPTSGAGLELLAIAAVVVGGVDIFGGKGSILGIALGAIFLQSIAAGMVFVGVDLAWQGAIIGLTILAAVSIFVVAQRSRQQREARGNA